jgi:hypothetical protein
VLVLVLVLAAAVLLSACGGISRSELEEEAQARGGGLGQTLPLEALEAIEAETGDRVLFTTMSMTLNSVTFEVLVPGSDDELDTWTSTSGNLRDPSPVSGAPPAEELRRRLIDPEAIVLDDLDALIDDAIAEADLADGYAQSVFISRPTPDRIVIAVTVTNPRNSVRVEYRGNGDRIEAAP